jgi:hypothetical protein
MARTARPIDYDLAHRLGRLGCTDEEIGTVLGFTREWICKRRARDKKLGEAIDSGRLKGKATLRRLQWQGAEAGNATMLIWLGKQLLGQRDRNDLEVSGRDGEPLAMQVVFVRPEDEEK